MTMQIPRQVPRRLTIGRIHDIIHSPSQHDSNTPPFVAHGVGITAVLVVALILLLTRDADNASIGLWGVTLASGFGMAGLWMLAAFGYGRIVTRLLPGDIDLHPSLQLTVGIATLLWIDIATGMLGLLQAAGNLGAWLVLLPGVAMASVQIRRAWGTRIPSPSLLIWVLIPVLAVLLVACASAPGWLWASEFGGYDVLSYHLQAPREWLEHGVIQPLDHNVYSALPSYVEAAYYHLAALFGSELDAAYACQFLHACFAIATAWTLAHAVSCLSSDRRAGLISGIITLGTPWVVVVASLAYNEMAVTLMLAGIIGLLAQPTDAGPASRGGAVGWLAGIACGAKLTAAGFVAAPALLLVVLILPRRAIPRSLLAMILAGAVAGSPYLISNTVRTGNPVFPFASSVFGTGHWTPEQTATWDRGHRADGTLPDRLHMAWTQWPAYGIGANPDKSEPWWPQWLILPWLGIAGLCLGLTSPETRRWSIMLLLMLILQFVFWVTMTHIKSRFMLPTVIPLSIGAAFAARWLEDSLAPVGRALITVFLIVWCVTPAMLFWSERDGASAAMVGGIGLRTGTALDAGDRAELATVSPEIYLNFGLPENARVLLVGNAAPFYIRTPHGWTTTWDRGQISILLRDDPSGTTWVERLRAVGWTHVLVDAPMLRRWTEERWNDPLLTAESVLEAFAGRARVLQEFPGSNVVFELPDDP